MKVPITPLADYVVIKAKEKETKTAGGLYLPESAAKESSTAVVAAIGPDVKSIKVGSRIIYKNEYDAVKVTADDTDYVLIKLENIIATVK